MSTGLYTIYSPDVTQLQAFSKWLWEPNLFEKLFTDPLQLIVGLYLCPILPHLGNNKNIALGGLDSGVDAMTVTQDYQYFSFGSLTIANFYGNFLDYQSTVMLYLPYIGYREINIQEFMGGEIYIDYMVSFSTGMCIAFVRSKKEDMFSVIYQYAGNIYSEIPLTNQNANQLLGTVVNSVLSTGTSIASGNPLATANALTSSAVNVLTSQRNFDRTGNLSINAGYLSVQKAYLIMIRPKLSLPKNFKKDIGYLSNVTVDLSTITGYTKVLYADYSDIPCTDVERKEIETLLSEGVYF